MRSRLIVFAPLLLTACNLAPDFELPALEIPGFFAAEAEAPVSTVEPATDGKWKRFDETAKINETAWWRMFGDSTLDGLMEQAMADNPSLAAALERVNSARATADTRNADLWPSIGLGVGPERSRQSPAAQEPNLPPGQSPVVKPYTLYTARGTISYDLDLFGRNRGRARAAEADADALADDYLTARLGLQAELAQTYFRLAALTQEADILARTVKAREESLALNRSKHEVGAIDDLVLATSEAELATAQAESSAVAQAKAAAQHALAILVGRPPASFAVPKTALVNALPVVPAGMPSSLLERRPDIRAAVQKMIAQNERIGIARTGYFPEIGLSLSGGFVSGELSDLFKWSNRTWLIGPLAGTILTQPIFEGGRLAAARAQSRADYAESVANYRTSVLQAFREVEDQLSALTNLSTQAAATERALKAANRAYAAAKSRYDVGYASHLEFLDAERSRLAAERTNVQVAGERHISTVQLIRALGGGWQKPAAPETTGTTP